MLLLLYIPPLFPSFGRSTRSFIRGEVKKGKGGGGGEERVSDEVGREGGMPYCHSHAVRPFFALSFSFPHFPTFSNVLHFFAILQLLCCQYFHLLIIF